MNLLSFDDVFSATCAENLRTAQITLVSCSSLADLEDSHYSDTDILVVRLGITLNEAAIKKFTRLQTIATVTTGIDHVNTEYCRKHGIQFISLKGEVAFLNTVTATPEMTWCLLLALVRKLPQCFAHVTAGKWARIPELWGHELHGKSIGILGFGRVGKVVAKYAHAFGMTVFASDIMQIETQQFPVTQLTADDLIRTVDILTVHLPLEDSTVHYLNENRLRTMKASSYLINTARGAIVNTEALVQALEKKWIAGAALDVVENETIDGYVNGQHPLIAYAKNNANLIISPHVAGSTYESMKKTASFICEKILVPQHSRNPANT